MIEEGNNLRAALAPPLLSGRHRFAIHQFQRIGEVGVDVGLGLVVVGIVGRARIVAGAGAQGLDVEQIHFALMLLCRRGLDGELFGVGVKAGRGAGLAGEVCADKEQPAEQIARTTHKAGPLLSEIVRSFQNADFIPEHLNQKSLERPKVIDLLDWLQVTRCLICGRIESSAEQVGNPRAAGKRSERRAHGIGEAEQNLLSRRAGRERLSISTVEDQPGTEAIGQAGLCGTEAEFGSGLWPP